MDAKSYLYIKVIQTFPQHRIVHVEEFNRRHDLLAYCAIQGIQEVDWIYYEANLGRLSECQN